MSEIKIDADMIERVVDEILSKGFKDMDPLMQEHLMEKLEDARDAFDSQQFDETLKILKHCDQVGRFRNFQIPGKEGLA